MIEQIFASLADSFKDEVVVKPTSYYFSLGILKKPSCFLKTGVGLRMGER